MIGSSPTAQVAPNMHDDDEGARQQALYKVTKADVPHICMTTKDR